MKISAPAVEEAVNYFAWKWCIMGVVNMGAHISVAIKAYIPFRDYDKINRDKWD